MLSLSIFRHFLLSAFTTLVWFLGIVHCCFTGSLPALYPLLYFYTCMTPLPFDFGSDPPLHCRSHTHRASSSHTQFAFQCSPPLSLKCASMLMAHPSVTWLSFPICFPSPAFYGMIYPSLFFLSFCLYHPPFSFLIVIVCNWEETYSGHRLPTLKIDRQRPYAPRRATKFLTGDGLERV